MSSFEALVAEAAAERTEGWDFSWFDGRANELRPSSGYQRLLSERMARASAALDLQTGGGEVLAGIATAPAKLFATESWLPNVTVAKEAEPARCPYRRLRQRRASLRAYELRPRRRQASGYHAVGGDRSGTRRRRLLLLGAGSNRELTDFFMGPHPISDRRRRERHVDPAQRAGLDVLDLREESLLVEFFDVGAVVYFLRKVLWTVPGFSVANYHDPLLEMHRLIERGGRFTAHSEGFLIEARKPI
jgi:hypothetical protein